MATRIGGGVSLSSSGPPPPPDPPAAPAAPPPPPPPPPPPFTCDDSGHCSLGVNCQQHNTHICPGLGAAGIATPLSFNNILHPGPVPLQVCGNCLTHWNAGAPPNTRFRANAGLGTHTNGYRAQLCHDCIRDEMEMYWLRQGTPRPAGPPSLNMVAQWPQLANGRQDLCICMEKVQRPFRHHCHACREAALAQLAHNDKFHAEDILGTRTGPVIKGEKTCTANGGTRPHTISAAQQLNRRTRHRVGRQCPCGKRPKAPINPHTQEYITYCLACMGVRVTERNLPDEYQKDNIIGPGNVREPRRRSARLAGRNNVVAAPAGAGQPPVVYQRTKGPRRAPRSHLFRVNVERGWVPNDPLVGGTY